MVFFALSMWFWLCIFSATCEFNWFAFNCTAQQKKAINPNVQVSLNSPKIIILQFNLIQSDFS